MEDDHDPPAGEVLGPLPLWTTTAVIAGLVGEAVGERAGAQVAAWTVGPLPLAWWTVCLMAGVLVAVALRWWRAPPDVQRVATGLVGVVLVAAVCGGGTFLRVMTMDEGLLPELAQQGGSRSIEAVVVHEPRLIATGWSVVVRVDDVGGTATRERAALTLDGPPPTLGSRWHARVSARPLPEGGYGRWLSRQHATVLLDVSAWQQAGAPGHLAAASEYVRERIRQAATRHLGDGTGGLLVGFVTGDTRLLPDDDQEAMRATGLTHLTAVSGANVAIVIGGVLMLASLMRLPAPWSRRAVALTVVGFALLTRFEPSVLRAGTMALVVLTVAARGVARDARHALAGAVLLLLLLDPRLAGSLGLLLSASATAGVLVVAPVVRERLPRMPRWLADVTSITIGAQIAVVPLLLATFGELTVASVPANLVAVPAAAVAAVLSFIGSVLALIHLDVGGLVFAVAGLPARGVLLAAHGFAGMGGSVELARPATVLALLGGCGWLLAGRGTRVARVALAGLAAGLLAAAVPMVAGSLAPREFAVTAIDVGQGDAFLIESPGARVLIDGGADDTAARWLRANGRRHLDLVVITHPHLDHVGGVPDVVRDLRVDAVWFRPLPTEIPEVAELFEAAAAQATPIRSPAIGDRVMVGDLLVEVLHPPSGRPYRWARSELNETSVVVRVTHQGRRVLAPGDIEADAQADLLATGAAGLVAEVLLVPHHGASTSAAEFFAAVDPIVAVISAGRDNRHGHPHPETLATLQDRRIEVRRTDQEGTIRVAVPARDVMPDTGGGAADAGTADRSQLPVRITS